MTEIEVELEKKKRKGHVTSMPGRTWSSVFVLEQAAAAG